MKIYIIILLALFSCKASTDNKSNCNENLMFKEIFYNHLANVDLYYVNNAQERKDSLSFEEKVDEIEKEELNYFKALDFFSQYPKITYKYVGSYTGKIPYHKYVVEKKSWLEWYEKNKCNNLKLKDTK